MKDYTISKKIDDKHVTMITIKDGWKVGFSPAFKKEIKAWLNSPNDDWLNLNLKEWDSKPKQAEDYSQNPVYANLNDEVPF